MRDVTPQSLLRSRAGSFMSAALFAFISVIVLVAIVAGSLTISLLQRSSQQSQAAGAVAENRLQAFLSDLNKYTTNVVDPAAPNTNKTCYTQLGYCAQVTNFDLASALDTTQTTLPVSLLVTSVDGSWSKTYDVYLSGRKVSHLADIDGSGRSTWVNTDGAGQVDN